MTNTYPSNLPLEVLLIDGTPQGAVKISSKSSPTMAFKFSRKATANKEFRRQMVEYRGLTNPGIYFLYAKPLDSKQPRIYVGKVGFRLGKDKDAALIFQRQGEHDAHADQDWAEEIFFFTTEQGMNSTELSYLENAFFKILEDCGKYKLDQGVPSSSLITEAEKAYLPEYIKWAKTYLYMLGLDIYKEPKPKPGTEKETTEGEQAKQEKQDSTSSQLAPGLYEFCSSNQQSGNPIVARLLITNDNRYILQKGSTVSSKTTYPKDLSQSTIDQRKEAIEKGYLTKTGNGEYILNVDCQFSSPSAAIRFVTGRKPQQISRDFKLVKE